MSDICDTEKAAAELLDALKRAAMTRMDEEKVNTDHHLLFVKAGHAAYEDALANEKEVLNAWGKWYQEAFASVTTLVDDPSEELLSAIDSAKAEMEEKTAECLAYAEQVLGNADSADPT